MPKTTFTRALLMSACSMAFALPAVAQENAADETDPNVIIVTAQNRAQNVNDVPIAISVVNAEQLQQAGFSNMNDIGKIAPAVQLNQDQGTIKVTVRGVGTNSNDESQDTSVVVNIDGEYMNRPQALSIALFDLDRVEVLRGPQGTLYGRNATGGAINFITRKPGKEFAANASASYGNYNAVRLDGGVTVPLGDVGGIRLAGFYDEHDGYVKHPSRAPFNLRGFNFPAFAGGRSDDNKSYGGRASIQLEPTDALTVYVAGEYAKREFTPQAFAAADLNAAGNGPTNRNCATAPGFSQVAPAYAARGQVLCIPNQTNFLANFDRGEYQAPAFGLGKLTQDTYALRGRLAYEVSDALTISYIGGYRKFDGTPGQVITLPVNYRSFGWNQQTSTQSHELRFAGEARGITYQVGGFYFKETVNSESSFATTFGPNVVTLSYFGRDITSESKSAFGQVEVPLGETLTAVGGLRYTENSRDALYRNATPFGAGPPDPQLFGIEPARRDFANLRFKTIFPLSSREDKITWLAGLNYKPNNDTLIFAKASTGFKGGGFDSVGDYKPESNTAYELGWKQTFGDQSQHQFNLGGFYYDYKDLQVSVLLDTAVGGQTFNAGKAKIWGIEASADFSLSDNDRFHASVNYLNAEYKELFAQFNVFDTTSALNGIGDLDPVTPGVQQPNFAGNRPPFSPEWVITAGYDHTFNLGSAGTVRASANTTFKSSYFTDFYNYRDGQQKAFTQTDVSLEYKPENGRFSLTAFAKNLENMRPLTYGSFVSAGPFDDVFNWQFGTPGTYGVRLAVDF